MNATSDAKKRCTCEYYEKRGYNIHCPVHGQ